MLPRKKKKNEEISKEQFIQQNRAIGGSTALAKLAERKDGKRFLELLTHGSMLVEIYKPEKVDLQQIHSRDELYVVYSGSGTFFNDGIRHPFQAGDVLFVPAGIEHRFEDFSEDFATWVVFYGPEGGEASLKEQSINLYTENS